MIIEGINIKSFGMITDMSLTFSDSINVIVGRNEAGKSTIAAFIKYMLYGFGNDSVPEGDADERMKRVNWDNGIASGTMTVRVDGKRYLISRISERVENGQRASYKEDCTITDLETGSPAFGKVPAGEVFFGVDRELFENTAFIGQIGDSSINEGSVKQSIENILFSGSEQINNRRAATNVGVKMENLFHKTGSGGAIYELRKRTEQLEERFKAADEDNKLILAKEAELHEIHMKKKKEVELLERLTDLENCHKNVLIIQSFDELHALEKKLDEKNEEYASYVEFNRRAGFVPDDAFYSEIGFARRNVDDAYRALVAADEKYAKEKQVAGITAEIEGQIEACDTHGGEGTVIGRAKKLIGKEILNGFLAGVGALVAIAAVVVEIIATGVLASIPLRILFGILGAGGLGLMGYMLYGYFGAKRELDALKADFATESMDDLVSKLSVISEERARRDKLMRDIEDARVAFEGAKASYERAKAALLDVILRWGEEPPTSNLNEFLDALEEKTKNYLDGEKKILAERNDIEISVRELRRHLADKSEIDIRAQVSPLKRKVLNEIDPDSLLDGIKECNGRIAEQDHLADAVENELAMLKIRATDPGELYAKMQENDSRIEELILTYEACELAKGAIEKASDNLRLEISPRLGEYTTALMQIMTNKKYTDMDVSDGLKVSFTAPDGEKRSIDFLSGGTRDLTYVALRMALIDMLYTECPPVCFDESFAHQDNGRAKAMMSAIKLLGEEGQQSFIFTCREREAVLAKEANSASAVYKLTTGDDDIA